jgi:type I restriction enzyme S subunit
VKRLVDLCHNTGDYGINAPAVSYSDTLPTYLRITDIDNWGKFIKADKVSVNHPNSSQYILNEGDIVFARTGATVGKTYLYDSKDGELVYAGFLIRFSPNVEKTHPYHIKTYTETSAYWNWVRIISQRSGQPGINSVEYGSMKLPVPPLAEQKKIAEILGVWDEAIEKQSRLIEKLELRKRGLMQRLLTGKTRLHGFTEPWQKVKLREICNITTGKLDANAMNIYGIYPFFTCAKEVSKINQFAFDTEALLISGNGEHLGYVHYYKGKFNAYQRTYVLNNFTQNIFYMFYTLKQNLPKRILQTKSSSNTPYIIMETLTNMEIALPNNQEQKLLRRC